MAEFWAAGILPVAVHPVDGGAMVLLGRDEWSKGGHWSDFAGGGEREDACPRHTALRELQEETGGALTMRLADLDGALEFRGATPSGKALHRYVVAMAYDAALPSRFRGSKDGEKMAMAWFPLRELPRLRRVFGLQMREDAPAIAAFAVKSAARGARGT